jgi:predicted RNase H-like HicB family nuclease
MFEVETRLLVSRRVRHSKLNSQMPVKSQREATLAEYRAEVLRNAVYEPGEELDVIVAEAPDLPGCMTQGNTFEEARENLIDAIEVWLMSGLRSGEDPPVVNGHRLAITAGPRKRRRA